MTSLPTSLAKANPAAPDPDRMPAVPPAVMAVRKALVAQLLGLMAMRNMSHRDFADSVGTKLHRLQDVLRCRAPMPGEWIVLLPFRDGLDMNARVNALIMSRRAA